MNYLFLNDNKLIMYKNKRKTFDSNIIAHTNSTLDCNSIIYYDSRDNSKINVTNNHIYFNATINDNSINNLIKCINNIIELKNKDYDKTIILHINSMGGILKSIINFINYINTIEYFIISIIGNHCNDTAIVLACSCNYRIIKKKSQIILSYYNYSNYSNYSNSSNIYWGLYNQELPHNDFICLLTSIFNSVLHIQENKIEQYLQQTKVFNAKKYKKMKLVDEIV